MHHELRLQRLAWLTRHIRILPADFQREGLTHRVVKEGREVHPHAVQRVGLLNVKPNHQLAALTLQSVGFFSRAVVVGVVVSERLNVHQAVVVRNARLVGEVGRPHFIFPKAHMEHGKRIAQRRVEQVCEDLKVVDVVGFEQALNAVVDHRPCGRCV